MGMYGDVLNKLDTGNFVKIEPGHPVKLRILDHPHVSSRKFQSGDVSTRFTWPVWDYEQQRVRVLEQGKSVFEQIGTACETWPQGDEMPAPFDIVIKREGTGQFDTRYTVSAVPYVAGCPNSSELDLPDIAGISKGIPLQDILEGKKPELIEAGKSAPALDSGQPDVVPTDLDSKVDLDSIPF